MCDELCTCATLIQEVAIKRCNLPKFPQFAFYEWAIEQMLDGMIEKEQGEHIVKSLEKMLMGGLYDHVRGGVHRYSTDQQWLIPHFGKDMTRSPIPYINSITIYTLFIHYIKPHN